MMIRSVPILPLVVALLLLWMGGAGCHPAYKATASAARVQHELCAEEWLLFPDQPHPMFIGLPGTVPDPPADMPLPRKYRRYTVAADTLKALFTRLRSSNEKTGIILPIENNCVAFQLQVSGTMSNALQEKYGELISVQGQGIQNKAADVRLDWNGRQMRGQVTYNGAIYFIMGLTDNNVTTYLVYNREDSAEEKKPFESTAPNQKDVHKVLYDR